MNASPASAEPELLPARRLGEGLAALRIFVGIILFSNGLAKLFNFREIEIGPYKTFLITRDEARNILDFEVNRRGGGGTDVPFLKTLVNDVMLPGWDGFQWMITGLELGAGLALILGFATGAFALMAFGQQFFLQVVYASSGRWMFEQPHEWVPLLILALVPAGRVWGFDRRFTSRGIKKLRGWPF